MFGILPAFRDSHTSFGLLLIRALCFLCARTQTLASDQQVASYVDETSALSTDDTVVGTDLPTVPAGADRELVLVRQFLCFAFVLWTTCSHWISSVLFHDMFI